MTPFQPRDRVHLKGHAHTPENTGTVTRRASDGRIFVQWDDTWGITPHPSSNLEPLGEPMSKRTDFLDADGNPMTPTPPPLDLAALTLIANAATPGEWSHRILMATKRGAVTALNSEGELVPVVTRGIDPVNSEHIAAFDPPTALALIARAETSTAALDFYVAQRKELQSTLEMVADRMDEFAYDELSSLILDDHYDEWGESYRSKLDATTARAEAAEAKIAAVEAALEKYEYDIPGHGDLIETRYVRAALDGTA